ncbi:MAG TPA: TIGR00730 family Rossman fold protein [Bacteroidota bacterium]|nr:TIGR00730 family Rossman fold protein [Bacteroidota bacterium]
MKDNKSENHHDLKAYNNREFLHSPEARTIRILSEYLYPEQYFRKHKVKGTIVFFGSARSMSKKDYEEELASLQTQLANSIDPKERDDLSYEIEELKSREDISNYYDDCVEISRMLSEWLKTNPTTKGIYVCTGGGGGMMEAANYGASLANLTNIGLNISLPYEQHPNHYISKNMVLEFHYFFMRKFWFVYLAKALFAMPGGFGTLDELFEILTLRQTHKITKPLPIVLYGKNYWDNLLNFDYLIKKGMIKKSDLDLFHFSDSPQEAFEYIKNEILKNYSTKIKKDFEQEF